MVLLIVWNMMLSVPYQEGFQVETQPRISIRPGFTSQRGYCSGGEGLSRLVHHGRHSFE